MGKGSLFFKKFKVQHNLNAHNIFFFKIGLKATLMAVIVTQVKVGACLTP